MPKELQEAMFWTKERGKVHCNLCVKNCSIPEGKAGFCLVRRNTGNKLYSTNYEQVVATNTEVIEKAPLFHFYPGSTTLSLSCRGPILTSQFSEMWQITHDKLPIVSEKEFSPEDIVSMAEKRNCKSITFTYIEPTIYFEFMYRTFKLAHRSNIKTTLVTNGYMNEDPVKKLCKYLDAVTFDVKASGDIEYLKKFTILQDSDHIYDLLKLFKKHRAHIEITNLIVPQIGDNVELCEKLADWINGELGGDVPFHLLQFIPDPTLTELPQTPMNTLERCADVAKKSGLRYVYISVPQHQDESTHCYNCRELLIHRMASTVKKTNLVKDRCPNCGVRINLVVD